MYNTQLQCPFSAIISGGSGTGKTTLLFNLLQCQGYLFSEKPAKTFLFYKKYQKIYDELLRLKLVQELTTKTGSGSYLDMFFMFCKKKFVICLVGYFFYSGFVIDAVSYI